MVSTSIRNSRTTLQKGNISIASGRSIIVCVDSALTHRNDPDVCIAQATTGRRMQDEPREIGSPAKPAASNAETCCFRVRLSSLWTRYVERQNESASCCFFLFSEFTTGEVLDDPQSEELGHSLSLESTDVQEITPFLPGDTVAYLRLADEERKFPFRPIGSGIFLIGQGPGCDLRLGLEDMPAIHSAIQMSESGAELTRIAESPELLVNGEPVDHIHLEHGDLIEVGDVRLAYYLCDHSTAIASEKPVDHSKLSARQLVDGLEFELDLLDADSSRTGRIGELLKAAQQAVDACQFAQTIRFADYAARKTTEETASQPDSYLQVLNRLSSQETRLDEICNVLEQVVHQQQMIATALQCVVERLDDMRAGGTPGAMRASA